MRSGTLAGWWNLALENPKRSVLVIALGWFVLRLGYLVFLSPWDLLGDEAYYWIQGQHLSLSYAEKGPILAWLLHLFCAVGGNHAWVVRLPVLIGSFLGAWGVGRLTLWIAPKSRAAPIYAVLLYILVPAFLGNAQICTQDGLLIPWFVALSALGLQVIRRWEADAPNWGAWMAFYAVLGVGILLKQSILLFLSSFAVYAVVRWRHLRWSPTLVLQQVAGGLVMLVACAPLIIWDAHNDWPLVRHTLEHLGIIQGAYFKEKGDYSLFWVVNSTVSLIGAGGPILFLMGWASIDAWRRRAEDAERWRDALWLICTAWPSIAFFILLSLVKAIVPSWPLPSMVSLVPLAAVVLGGGSTGRRPIPPGPRRMWRWGIAYGVLILVLLSFPNLTGYLPRVGPLMREKVLSRFMGEAAQTEEIAALARAHPSVQSVVFGHYQEASQLAFYLKGPWTVRCAGSLLGPRVSNFDKWSDTSLYHPDALGEDMLLLGRSLEQWKAGMRFDSIEPIGENAFLGRNYQGPANPHVHGEQK